MISNNSRNHRVFGIGNLIGGVMSCGSIPKKKKKLGEEKLGEEKRTK